VLPLLDDLVQAHGVGGQKDLPIPLSLAVSGAVAALVVSFTVLVLAWRSPRYDAATSGRPAPAWLDRTVRSVPFRAGLRVVGFALFAYTAVVAVLGQNLFINPLFGLFYVVLWVGVVFASALLGSVWKAISPVRTINLAFAKLSGSDPDRGVYDYPARLGYWPAALGLYAFVWIELVYPFQTELASVRLWAAVYLASTLVGGALFGSGFYERADPFEVLSTLIGKLSPWSVRDGHLIVRSPLANLDSVDVRPGLVAVVAILFGSTGYDSFRESSRWVQYVQNSSLSENVLNNLALLAFCLGVGLVFLIGSMLTGVGPEIPRRELPDRLAHAIVPIILGYFVAHYLTYFYEVSQRTLQYASDPLSDGTDLLGTADLQINYWFSGHQTLVAILKVGAVVIGHVLGAMAAHDRTIKILPLRHQITGQLPLLFAMIAFTAGGLYLLFAS
jgi:hypothetical protein